MTNIREAFFPVLAFLRAGRMVRDTTARRIRDLTCIAERGDDFMRGGEMQGAL
jgi:hypothetical protein